jgi:hypothetical protein
MDRVKGDYDNEIKSVLGDQVYQAVKSRSQGFPSTTYFVTFADSSSIVIQFRPVSRPIDTKAVSSARSRLGCLVPEFQLLDIIENNSVLVYKMTRLPGDSFSMLMDTPEFIHLLPSIAENMGHLLGMCFIPCSRAGDDRTWFEVVQKHLLFAAESNDPLVVVNRSHYRRLLEVVRSGALDDLPVAISNDDVSPTNIIVDRHAVGLVDWEYVVHYPLGYETRAVFWLMGRGLDEYYELYENAPQVEDAFWKGFGAQLPDTVRKQSVAIQSAMQVGAALSTCVFGKYTPGHFASLPFMLKYNIPPAFLASE